MKNELYSSSQHLIQRSCLHSLIWDDLEDQVVQQCEVLSYLQGRVTLKRFGFTVLHSLTQTR